MGAVRRQVVALVVTVVLALTAPFGPPKSCDRCPVGCPMHQRDAGAHAPSCHHGGTTDAGGATMRCACGHHRAAAPTAIDPGLAPRVVSVVPTLVPRRVATVVPVRDGRTAPEPQPEPPRHVVI